MGYSISILNNIRANASNEYQTRIPEATRNNISEIGNALQTYELLFNEFASALVNKIGKTLIEGKLFKNKLARFKSGEVLSQQDVEEIFIDMAKNVEPYDPDGKTTLARFKDDNVKAVYHRMNRQDCYPLSIGDIDFIRVFRNEHTLDVFIAGKINAVYSKASHDEWLIMKELLATYKNEEGECGYFDYEVPVIAGEDASVTAKTFVKTLRKANLDLSFASDKYNTAGVMQWNDSKELVLFIHKDVLAEVDVEVLAKAFNLGKTDIENKIVVMDDFGSLTDTYGILADESFFKVFDTLSTMRTQVNAQGLFTNYFYHVHQILSLSPFKNAVRFKSVTA